MRLAFVGAVLVCGCNVVLPLGGLGGSTDAETDLAAVDAQLADGLRPVDALPADLALQDVQGPVDIQINDIFGKPKESGVAPGWNPLTVVGASWSNTTAAHIWGVDAGEIYISVGWQIWQCADSTTQLACSSVPASSSSKPVYGLGGPAGAPTHAVGYSGQVRSSVDGFKTNQCMSASCGSLYFRDIHCNGPVCGLVGIDGSLLGAAGSFNAGVFTRSVFYTQGELAGVWVSPGGEIVAVGAKCGVWVGAGSWLPVIVPGCAGDIRAVWGVTGTDVVAVGQSAKGLGLYVTRKSSQWSTSEEGKPLHALWGSGGKVFGVGDEGTVRVYENGAWSQPEVVSQEPLTDVWGTGAAVYAVGHNSTLMRHAP